MPRTIPVRPSRARTLAFNEDTALGWLFAYRLVLVSVLLVLSVFPATSPWLVSGGDPTTARLVLLVQSVLVLLSGLLVITDWPEREKQVQLAVFFDIVAYTLLMHVSGGVATGLGLLPAIAVAAGALLLEGRLSLLFASLAALGVMTQQVYSDLYLGSQSGTYTQAGLLGLTYFSVALLAHVLATRLRETERIAARRKVDIADLSKLNEYVIQGLSTGVVVIDGERRLLLLNNAARRLLAAPDARPGDALFDVAPQMRHWLTRELAGSSPPDQVVELGGGEARPSLTLLGDERVNGALIYLRDSQDLVRQAQEIKLASLGRLTASIAHNIRNPLSAVTHAAQLISENPELPDDDRRLLEILRRNALRIDETVTSVLELSRRHQADPSLIDLRLWISDFCEEYRDGQGLPPPSLSWSAPPAAQPMTVRVDPRHLRQILRNLCDNGFKHASVQGRPARVELRLRREATSGECILTVADDGPGVPPAQRPHLFEPFFTTSSTGTGLGLYTARELAEANGMRLEYLDAGDGGARFRLAFSE